MGFRVMGVYSGGQTTPHIFNFLTGKLWDPEKFLRLNCKDVLYVDIC